MGEVINLAGKEIIADHITTNENGQNVSLFQAATMKKTQKVIEDTDKHTQGRIDDLSGDVDDLSGDLRDLSGDVSALSGNVTDISNNRAKIGARVQAEDGYDYLNVYAYNPLKAYSLSWGADYYVNTGYVSANGQTCPVFIPGKRVSYLVSGFSKGTWAILIRKLSVLDEAWSIDVLLPEPNSSNIMQWKKPDGTVVNLDTDAWVIGSFIYDSLDGITSLNINNEAATPAGFLKNRFLQIMNDCDGVDTSDFTNWAIAMKCDAIFKRLAALELFADRFRAQNLEVGTYGSGFNFRALTDDRTAQHNKIFDVTYNGNVLFKVDVPTGKIYFGQGFWYDPTPGDMAIHSADDKVIITAEGSLKANGAVITGDSEFNGSFNCSVIKTADYGSASNVFTTQNNTVHQARALSLAIRGYGLKQRTYYECSISGASLIKYIYINEGQSDPDSPSYWSTSIYFYGTNKNLVDIRNYMTVSDNYGYADQFKKYIHCSNTMNNTEYGVWVPNGFTVNIITSGKVLELKIPSETETGLLSTGQMYYKSDGSLYVKV